MSNDNLSIWKQVEETDPNQTKKVSFGNRNYTTISAQYQIKQATELFGLYGEKWGIKSLDFEFINLDRSQVMALGKAVFFYTLEREPQSFPISSTIMVQEWSDRKKCLVVDDEWAKKLETDIATKALSKLGFAADVFMGRYDDNKYVNRLKEKYGEEKPQKDGKNQSKPQQSSNTPKSDEKPKEWAAKKDIDSLMKLVNTNQIQRAKDGLKYWMSENRGISRANKKMVEDLIKVMEYNKNKNQ